MKEQIYHQHYWGAVWVKPNASIDYYSAIQAGETYNLSDAYHVMFETGRHYAAVNSILAKSITGLQTVILMLQPKLITGPIMKKLSSSSSSSSISEATMANFIVPIMFTSHDLTKASLNIPIALAPQQFGPIYLNVLSLMQLSFFVPYHAKLSKHMKNSTYLIFRVISSQITYLMIALAYSLVQVAFKIDLYTAYKGKSGFMAFWMVSYLLLSALGGVNENVVILLQAFAPNMVPSFSIFWIILNVGVTTYPLILCPKFYRYGYAMPILNGYELYKMILFDTYKGASIARNIVILLAWVIITVITMPLCIGVLVKHKRKEAAAKVKTLKKEKKRRLLNLKIHDKSNGNAANGERVAVDTEKQGFDS
ncbi:unnamed protein product [Ambrosiozyma monospora]|uniref:Unnamed protein product n=1 Tax=Ambrosiozyma monospora TaxID=43982 RepID=A0ACB5TJQ0_AMBMO|nr:unnamed protein product [Ambrosiozyma monospora]